MTVPGLLPLLDVVGGELEVPTVPYGTRRYANLVTADLQAVHERVSLLATN